jgi:FKBP-type peptidyl-prolyl cis-trans isomerase 2
MSVLHETEADVIVPLLKRSISILNLWRIRMKVEKGKLISLEYTITTKQGEMIESSVGRGEPLSFVFGTDSGLPDGLTEQLTGMKKNDEKEFDVLPEKAFGTVESGPEMILPTNAFPKNTKIKAGESFEGTMPNSDQTVKFVIAENLGDKVKVRLIHPLAGKTIHIQAKILSVEDAPDLVEEEDGDEEE